MTIFNNNDRLQDLTMYSLDWAVYLRHNLEGPITPFLFLQKDDQMLIRVLVTEGNPMEYAKKVLATEEKSFDQFVIGFEGYISDDQKGTGRTDALIVHGFDITQDKGVSLAQAFIPKEKGGHFRKRDKVQFIGNPDLPLEKKRVDQPDYSTEELGFSGINFKKEELTAYVGIFTHKNPSVITDGMKRYLRGKLTEPDNARCSGSFELTVTPGLTTNTDFLKYTVLAALETELQSELVKNWEKLNHRKVSLICKYGDEPWMNSDEYDSGTESQNGSSSSGNDEQDKEKLNSRYTLFSEKELMDEFHRIVAIPDARTNITALIQMSALMETFKQRGIPLPVSGEMSPDQRTANSNTIKIFLVLLVIIILYFVLRT